MTNHIKALKIWQRAQKEGDILILNNTNLANIEIFVKGSRERTLDKNYWALRNLVLQRLEFQKIQRRKNMTEEELSLEK
jgi:hypothetical protein